jgi:hypothetical protein
MTYTVWFRLTNGVTVTKRFQAADNYTARTIALAMQANRGSDVAEAKIRQGAGWYVGPWFDLNEEG